jgi:hypothetical protein
MYFCSCAIGQIESFFSQCVLIFHSTGNLSCCSLSTKVCALCSSHLFFFILLPGTVSVRDVWSCCVCCLGWTSLGICETHIYMYMCTAYCHSQITNSYRW